MMQRVWRGEIIEQMILRIIPVRLLLIAITYDFTTVWAIAPNNGLSS